MEIVLLLPLAALALISVVAVVLFKRRAIASNPVIDSALVVLAGLAFVYLGAGAINTLTNGRGAPSETAPWLALIAILAGATYLYVRRTGGGAAQRSDPSAIRQPDRHAAPSHPATDSPAPSPDAAAGHLMFISYRRSDSADITGRIYDRLVQQFGIDGVFKDVDSIPLGADFRTTIADAVGECRVLLAIIGKGWTTADDEGPRLHDPRDFVRVEIESAIERNVPLIPVLVQGASMPNRADLPATLQPLVFRNAISIRSDPDFHQDVGRLIKGIEAHL